MREPMRLAERWRHAGSPDRCRRTQGPRTRCGTSRCREEESSGGARRYTCCKVPSPRPVLFFSPDMLLHKTLGIEARPGHKMTDQQTSTARSPGTGTGTGAGTGTEPALASALFRAFHGARSNDDSSSSSSFSSSASESEDGIIPNALDLLLSRSVQSARPLLEPEPLEHSMLRNTTRVHRSRRSSTVSSCHAKSRADDLAGRSAEDGVPVPAGDGNGDAGEETPLLASHPASDETDTKTPRKRRAAAPTSTASRRPASGCSSCRSWPATSWPASTPPSSRPATRSSRPTLAAATAPRGCRPPSCSPRRASSRCWAACRTRWGGRRPTWRRPPSFWRPRRGAPWRAA
ncbi:hypothetical protein VTK56DRAFT_7624 [Thermocarpiscus australiensis]